MFYETQAACSDELFEYLMELQYNKKAHDTRNENWDNREIRRIPTVFDTPKYGD